MYIYKVIKILEVVNMAIDINMSIFISVWLGVGFGLPVAMLTLYYLQKLFKIKNKKNNYLKNYLQKFKYMI
jgi:hypothetical protein